MRWLRELIYRRRVPVRWPPDTAREAARHRAMLDRHDRELVHVAWPPAGARPPGRLLALHWAGWWLRPAPEPEDRGIGPELGPPAG